MINNAPPGSSLTHLRYYPLLHKETHLSSDNLKRAEEAQDKLPEEFLIQGAAYATAQSDSLLVAMKYKELIPVARQGQFGEKVQEVGRKLKEAWKRKTVRGRYRRRRRKPMPGTFEEPQAMGTYGCSTR